ncbi:MAG: DNA mismatch repair protein MutS [Pricia sp.]
MQDLISFYRQRIQTFSDELSRIKKRLFASSMVRLAVFVLAALGIYLVFGNVQWILAISIVAIALFLYLVSRHQNLQHERNRLQSLISINETEIQVLNRDFHDLPEGNEFKDSQHYFSQDIDLFGRGSFYQYVNRTALGQGSETLAGLLKENSVKDIPLKQGAIMELADMPEWRQNFSAIASLTKTKVSAAKIVEWLDGYTTFVPKAMRFIPWVFSAIAIILFVLYFTDLLPESVLAGWLFLGLGIKYLFSKKIAILGEYATEMQSTFHQYYQLLKQIEDTEFNSELLSSLRQDVTTEKEKASLISKKFSKLLYNLEKGNNLIYYFFGDGFFLRTLSHSYQIETWIKQHGSSVEKWFDTIAFFDAYNSLGNFAFNHPEYAYPVLTDTETTLKSEAAGHPLLHPKKSVRNDFQIDREQFFIITGANMAGKSTFLRTVSLQIVMANVGLPVCASSVHYSPIKLITSMRTTDSLTDDESYFFSELKRLKFIVDEIQQDRYFIVLDEILKGTNSTDKAKGSRKFVERLVTSKSTGIIATHDLSLCEVSKELPQIENHYFDAEIIDNELHFDYKFKEGICQNMNASFLLRKMEIV